MKLLKRNMDADSQLQTSEVDLKKTKFNTEEVVEDVKMSVDLIGCQGKPLKASQPPTRCQICLWPVTSAQCYHSKSWENGIIDLRIYLFYGCDWFWNKNFMIVFFPYRT